jgi:hypothetical protein
VRGAGSYTTVLRDAAASPTTNASGLSNRFMSGPKQVRVARFAYNGVKIHLRNLEIALRPCIRIRASAVDLELKELL